MAANYTYEYRNKEAAFPNAIPDKIEYKDVDANVASIVKSIEDCIFAGDYAQASSIMNEHAVELDGYMINALDVNRIIEDIRNTQIYARSRKQEIFFDESEPIVEHNDVWISSVL